MQCIVVYLECQNRSVMRSSHEASVCSMSVQFTANTTELGAYVVMYFVYGIHVVSCMCAAYIMY
jgi:hypothetical protein